MQKAQDRAAICMQMDKGGFKGAGNDGWEGLTLDIAGGIALLLVTHVWVSHSTEENNQGGKGMQSLGIEDTWANGMNKFAIIDPWTDDDNPSVEMATSPIPCGCVT